MSKDTTKPTPEELKANHIGKCVDGYLITSILFVAMIFLLLLFVIQKTKTNLYFLFSMMIAVGVVGLCQLRFGKTQITNRSGGTIYAKTETDGDTDTNGSNVFSIENGETCKDFDGIKVDDVVYKIPNGVHCTLTKDKKIRCNSLVSSLVYLGGGKITKSPDSGWDELCEV